MELLLYGTSECHLCEQALALVAATAGHGPAEYDVADDDALFARYGLRIPVLVRADTGAELDWPFDAVAVAGFISRAGS